MNFHLVYWYKAEKCCKICLMKLWTPLALKCDLQSHTESFVFEAGDANLGHVAATDYKDAQSRISVLQGKLAYFRHHPVTSRTSLKPLKKKKIVSFFTAQKIFCFPLYMCRLLTGPRRINHLPSNFSSAQSILVRGAKARSLSPARGKQH